MRAHSAFEFLGQRYALRDSFQRLLRCIDGFNQAAEQIINWRITGSTGRYAQR